MIKIKKEVMYTMESKIYTISEVCEMLKISRSFAYQMLKEEKIPSVKLGKRVIIPKNKFDNWLESL